MDEQLERIRAELMRDVQTRVQRLRELRDMTQDLAEGRRLDAAIGELQITLYDLEQMDEAGLRRAYERARGRVLATPHPPQPAAERAPAGTHRRAGTSALRTATAVAAVALATSGLLALLHKRRLLPTPTRRRRLRMPVLLA